MKVHGVFFILSLGREALFARVHTSAGTSRNSCSVQGHGKRNTILDIAMERSL